MKVWGQAGIEFVTPWSAAGLATDCPMGLDTKNESQEVSPFPAGDHKAHINTRTKA